MRSARGLALGRPFGIPLIVHASWVPAALLLVLHFAHAAYPHWPATRAIPAAVATTLAFFTCLVVHELAHALVARASGLPVANITLFVFGGVARITREPRKPRQEFVIAAAGPLVSVGLGVLALSGPGPILRTLGLCNLAIAVFNLLPGFPLDGGRIMRAVLWARGSDRYVAQQRASRMGQSIGSLIAAIGVAVALTTGAKIEGLWLVVLGTFLVALASSARRAAGVALRLESAAAGEWARPLAATVDAFDALPPGGIGPWGVAQGGRLVGIVTDPQFGRPAGEIMLPWTPDLAVDASASMARALERLQSVLVVLRDGIVVGILDRATVRSRIEAR